MIYVYGLVQAHGGGLQAFAPSDLEGVTGAVSIGACDGHMLIYGQHDGSEILARRRSLLAHARILEAAMSMGTVLPMRFGMTCRSVEAFEALVRRNCDGIAAALDRLRDRVEVGLRISAEDAPALEAALAASPRLSALRASLAASGAAAHFKEVEFGRALGELIAARRKTAQSQLLERLVPAAAAHVLKAPESDFEVLRAEFLVGHARLAAFTDLVEQCVGELNFAGGGEFQTQLVGPGPAFHFTDLALSPTDAEEAA